MRVGIIGAGLIGAKRAAALARIEGISIACIADTNLKAANKLRAQHGGLVTSNWEEVSKASNIDLVFVATPHEIAVPIVISCLNDGKHVLCEKPLGRSALESEQIVSAAESAGRVIKVGFNYRYYPHIKRAKALVDSGYLGEIQYLKAVLGHAARPGYQKEWRVDPSCGGGGALLDPGIHLVDLARYFMGEFTSASHAFQNAYWPLVFEDNAFALLQTANQKTASILSSITEWKNTFTLDIIGTDGYVKLSGRGGFYGPPRISWNKRWAWLNDKDPQEQTEEYNGEDNSFFEETVEFLQAIRDRRQPNGNGYDAIHAARLIDLIYEQHSKQ